MKKTIIPKILLLSILLIFSFLIYYFSFAFENPPSPPPTSGGVLRVLSNYLQINKTTKLIPSSNLIIQDGSLSINTQDVTSKINVYNPSSTLNVLKINQKSKSWAKTIGGSYSDFGYSISQTSDNGYIAIGRTYSYGTEGDILITKLDSSGNILWAKTIGGSNDDHGYSISQTSDNGYIAIGYTASYGTGGDILITKLDSSGNILWAKTIGGPNYEEGYSISQTSDNGYIAIGRTGSYGAGNSDILITKLDSSGNISGCNLVSSLNITASSVNPTNNFQNISSVSRTVSSSTLSISSSNQTVSSSFLCQADYNYTSLNFDSFSKLLFSNITSSLAMLDIPGKIRAKQFCFLDNCYSSIPEQPWQISGSSNIVFNNGNVGIGNISPSYKLTVSGDISLTGGSRFIGTTDNNSLNIRTNNSNRITILNTGQIGINTSTPTGTLQISNSSSTSAFVVSSIANIGIGTLTPSTLVEMYSNSKDVILTLNSNTSSSFSPIIQFKTGNPSSVRYSIGTLISSNNLKIVPLDSLSTTSGITVYPNGNVSINTSSSLYSLNIGANMSVEGCIYYNGGTLGTCVSDISLKKIIKPYSISNASYKISHLNPYYYSYLNDDSLRIGLIAQEVEKYIPELVYQDSKGIKYIKYSEIDWLIVEAIKDQINKINDLKGKIEDFKAGLLGE